MLVIRCFRCDKPTAGSPHNIPTRLLCLQCAVGKHEPDAPVTPAAFEPTSDELASVAMVGPDGEEH